MADLIYERTILNPHRQEVRILSILAGSQSAEIECKLERLSLAEKNLDFKSLSYTWGDPHETSPITLDDCPFKVSKNLSAALHHLRKETKIVKIWIDAVCINQNDINERNWQVQQMKEIYEKAEKVVIWLGEEDEDSSYAISAINNFDSRRAVGTRQVVDERHREFLNLDERAIRAINCLLSRSWRSRVWIIQEATCANQTCVKCGRDKTTFRAIVAITNYISLNLMKLSLLQDFSTPDMVLLQRVIALNELKTKRASPTYRSDLLELIDGARTCEASDPRDKVFALSGLASGAQRAAVIPAYSMSLKEAYIRFAYVFMGADQSLNILGHCQVAVQDAQSWSSLRSLPPALVPERPLPSWVPDWTMMLEATPFMKYAVKGDPSSKKIYNASRHFPPSVQLDEGLEVLSIRGFVFDAIAKLGEDFTSPLSISLIRRWHSWARTELGHTYHNRETTHQAFLHTLVADIGTTQGLCTRGFAAPWPLRDDLGATKDSFVSGSLLRMAVNNRGLFISKNGFMGLARFDITEQGKVCILFGGQVPVILRPEGKYYRFLAECYVHGLMDGESMGYPRIWEDFALV